MYALPFDQAPDLNGIPSQYVHNTAAGIPERLSGLPLLYEGVFNLTETGDTFMDMQNWGKGIVLVNGRNLGRFWNVGPQQTLYLPGVWLSKGENRIMVFDQLGDQPKTGISSVKTPVLNDLRTDLL